MEIAELITKDQLPSELICTPARFAYSVGVTESVVRHWIKDGILPVFRIRKRVFVNIAKLKQMLNDGVKRI